MPLRVLGLASKSIHLNFGLTWGWVNMTPDPLVFSRLHIHIIPPPLGNPLRSPWIGLLIDNHMAVFY